ncbi:hypothetical protein VTO42DRAFT_887 [Malbranchea cinnamomea]
MAYESDLGVLSYQRSNSISSRDSRTSKLRPDEGSLGNPRTTEAPEQSNGDGRQRLVFTDPVAFRYLEEDPSTEVLARRCTLTGYEIYIVEQWACSRIHPTFVINTYTGDPFHKVVVDVLSVPTDESAWSPRLKVYFHAMSQFHARRRETHLGVLMVTNLSRFPSSLTVIAVPDGDVKNHRRDYIVNEDLKRLGCSGRAGLNLKPPSPATEAKFYQLYRASERVPFYDAVVELVRLCQMALTVFGKLPTEYVDGLLCDITERAINDWWTDIGTDLYNIEPSDGILGPTTVSALLGTLIGARNRLHAFGAPVPKDVFDLGAFKKGISSFQKSQKLDRTRRLDHQTLERLHRVTAKAAKGEGWTVPRAVKSTVAEFGGKGGEMVMGIVGARDKAGIAEVETLDIDRFVQLVQGERPKWLWHGKPRKYGGNNSQQEDKEEDLVFLKDDQGGYVWTSKTKETTEGFTSGRPSLETEPSWKQTETSGTAEDRDWQIKPSSMKLVAGKVSDARAGLGRIRDAVGMHNLRSHQYKLSKDSIDIGIDQHGMGRHALAREALHSHKPTSSKQWQPPEIPKVESEQEPQDRSDVNFVQSNRCDIGLEVSLQESHGLQSRFQPGDPQTERVVSLEDREAPEAQVSQEAAMVKRLLQRPRSCPDFHLDHRIQLTDRKSSHLPRHLSFSTVEEALLTEDSSELGRLNLAPDATTNEAILYEDIVISDAQILGNKIDDLTDTVAPWVQNQIEGVESLGENAQSQLDDLNAMYQDKLQQYTALRTDSSEVITREGGNLIERTTTVELLGAKLDYELQVMESRIEEVEEGLGDYERNIVQLERRIQSLIQVDLQKSSSSWFKWAFRWFRREQGP